MKKKTSYIIVGIVAFFFLAEVLLCIPWRKSTRDILRSEPLEEAVEKVEVEEVDPYSDEYTEDEYAEECAAEYIEEAPSLSVEETAVEEPQATKAQTPKIMVIDATGQPGIATPHRKMVIRDNDRRISLHLNGNLDYNGAVAADTLVIVSPHGVYLY